MTIKLVIIGHWTEVFHFSFAVVTQLELHNLVIFQLASYEIWKKIGFMSGCACRDSLRIIISKLNAGLLLDSKLLNNSAIKFFYYEILNTNID
jgi:hypothetical protein